VVHHALEQIQIGNSLLAHTGDDQSRHVVVVAREAKWHCLVRRAMMFRVQQRGLFPVKINEAPRPGSANSAWSVQQTQKSFSTIWGLSRRRSAACTK
jgi:hypothetical protein